MLFNNLNRNLNSFLLNTTLSFGRLKNPFTPLYPEYRILSKWHLNYRNLVKLFWILYNVCNWYKDFDTHIRDPYSNGERTYD